MTAKLTTKVLIFLGLWLALALLDYWLLGGNDSKIDVYSQWQIDHVDFGKYYKYSEEMSTTGCILTSGMFGLIASTFIILIIWIIRKVWKRVS